MNSNIKARLEEMVREKVKQRRVSGMVGKSHLFIYPLVALDLLQERDAFKDKLAEAEAREWELQQKLFRSDCNAMGESWGHTLCAEQRDAAEAQVESLKLETKALTAERDERIKQLHLLLCEVQVNWPCTVYNNLLWGDILRRIDAALKLGGEK